MVVLGLAAAGLLGSGPGADPSGSEIQAWAAENQTTIATVVSLYAAQLFAFLIFFVGLRTVLRPGEPGDEPWSTLGLTGGIVLGAILAAQYVFPMPLAMGETEITEPGIARALLDLTYGLQSPWEVAVAVILLGYSLAMRRSPRFPRWLIYLGFLGAAVALVEGVAGIPTVRGFAEGSAVVLAGALLFPLWVLLTGIWLLRRPSTESKPAPA